MSSKIFFENNAKHFKIMLNKSCILIIHLCHVTSRLDIFDVDRDKILQTIKPLDSDDVRFYHDIPILMEVYLSFLWAGKISKCFWDYRAHRPLFFMDIFAKFFFLSKHKQFSKFVKFDYC